MRVIEGLTPGRGCRSKRLSSPIFAGIFLVALVSGIGQPVPAPPVTPAIVSGVTFTKVTGDPVVTSVGVAGGQSWGDYDNDGFVDLYVSNNGNGEPNFLFHNNRNGTFTRILDGRIVNDGKTSGGSRGCPWGDFDNDGFLDLFVASAGNDFLYRNLGDGTFTNVTADPIVQDKRFSDGGNWADYDNDGFLDLLMTTTDAQLGGVLYRNNGNSTFSVVKTNVVDLRKTASFASAWGDYDNDGYPDFYLVNGDGVRNLLYHNNRDGTFTKIAGGATTSGGNASFGCTWGDYDNDGFLDLFVANGNLVASQNNYLFHNNGDGTFTRVTTGIVVNDGGVSLGCAWADYDNDGFLDLFVTNSPSVNNLKRRNFLYRNRGDGTFEKITEGSPVTDLENSINCSWADYNNDGFMDLLVTSTDNELLYRNNGNNNNWINIRCVGTVSNRSAIGAKVRVKAVIGGQARWQMREISGGSGWASQNDTRAAFGLGDASIIETVRIEWPSGIVQELHDVPVKQFLTVTEPTRLEPQVKRATGLVELKVKSWKGFVYDIEASSDLKSWKLLTTLTNETGTLFFTDPASGNTTRFYRVLGK